LIKFAKYYISIIPNAIHGFEYIFCEVENWFKVHIETIWIQICGMEEFTFWNYKEVELYKTLTMID
jgi:hypothetical protein